MIKKIESVLVANRGEIAIRIIKTLKQMGIKSVGIYSDFDRNSLHVKLCDEAYYIGNSAPGESYLNISKIIEVAKSCKASAIHPGYGLLSENAEFSKACQDNEIKFIGPSTHSIKLMGLKTESKTLLKNTDVPLIPGADGAQKSLDELESMGEKLGFPLLVKASAGGGGKGMRIVNEKSDLRGALEAAKRESMNAFGNDELLLERYFPNVKHIEVQILSDSYGKIVHLFARDCSLQRRYQKVIEEAPASSVPGKLLEKIYQAALKVAKEVGYEGAGTVEFIWDLEEKNNFYFLEMNTRLQVEHPVTEMITGIDLVREQILIASGKALSFDQKDIKMKGHAIEARIYAEDPTNNFLPCTGIVGEIIPFEMDDVRYDLGVEKGSEIGIYYDPMIGKIIAHGSSREEARDKLIYALSKTILLGTVTNQNFLLSLLRENAFSFNEVSTNFIAKNIDKLINANDIGIVKYLMASFLYDFFKRKKEKKPLSFIAAGWRNNFYQYQTKKMVYINDEYLLEYQYLGSERFKVIINKENFCQLKLINFKNNKLIFELDKKIQTLQVYLKEKLPLGEKILNLYSKEGGAVSLKILSRFPDLKAQVNKGDYISPMPGKISRLLVKEGSLVQKGEDLLVMESMKMENTIEAHSTGIVKEIFVNSGDLVEANAKLVSITEDK